MALEFSDKFNAREKAFVRFMIEGLPQTVAAKQAGYGDYKAAARRLLAKPHIEEAVYNGQLDMQAKTNLTRSDVIEGLRAAIEDAKMLADPSSQIKGWSEIARILGFYQPDKKEIVLTASQQEVIRKLDVLNTEQLLLIAGESTLDVIDSTCEVIQDGDA